jgi:SAM-dependent methyltransferase
MTKQNDMEFPWKSIFSKSYNELSVGIERQLRENGFIKSDNRSLSVSDFKLYLRFIASQVKTFLRSNYIYEIGCGNGLFVSELAKLLQISDFGGSDLSDVRIKMARDLIPEGDWTCSDACSDLKIKGFVFANSVLQYFPNSAYFIDLIKRLEKSNISGLALLDIPMSNNDTYDFQSRGSYGEQSLRHIRYSPLWIESVIRMEFKSIEYISTFPQYPLNYHDETPRFNIVVKNA